VGSNHQDIQPTHSGPLQLSEENGQQKHIEPYMEPSYREHVSGHLGNPRRTVTHHPQPPAAPLPEGPNVVPPPATYTQPATYMGQAGAAGSARQPAGQQQRAGQYPAVWPPQASRGYPPYQPNQPYPNGSTNPYYQQPYASYQGQAWNGYSYPPTYNGYPGYPGTPYPYPYPYNGAYGSYAQPYGYYGYGYYQAQPKPKGSTYQRVIAIIALIFSSIAIFIGLACMGLLTLTVIGISMQNLNATQTASAFSGIALLTSLTLSGVGGGSFGLWHSIRALMRRPSIEFKLPSLQLKFPATAELRERWQSSSARRWQQAMISGNKLLVKVPWFVVFLLLYVIMIAIGLSVRGNAQIASDTWLTILLIGLSGLLPALTVMTLGAWRTHNPSDTHWPTTWRHFAMSLISGATSAILFAMILEAILEIVVSLGFGHINAFQLSDPNAPLPKDIHVILYMIILLSVIAPFVEEGVKPLAVITMLGRINSAAEAFTMGMACGIGFDLIETSSYIGMGYSNWVDIAIERSSAGLLHSFGAGMTALGWYLLTHRDSLPKRRVLIAFGCMLYAVLQHATWNASFLFSYLPAPVGPYIQNGVITIGSYQLPAELIIYAIETALMLIFLWFVTGKLRRLSSPRKSETPQQVPQATNVPPQFPGNNQPDPQGSYPQPVRS
jgi:hypothetical protein